MSHPFGLEPDEVKDEDHVDISNDTLYEDEMDRQKEQNDKAMEEHFTKEPENFGGGGGWI